MSQIISKPFYLNVSFIANPRPNIVWSKGSSTQTGSVSVYGDTGTAFLYFSSPTFNDAGDYSVIISNIAGSSSYSVNLNFTGMLFVITTIHVCVYGTHHCVDAYSSALLSVCNLCALELFI